MTKEELEKEAEDFLKKSLKVDDEFDFFKNEASCKEEIKRLTDFVEPREKRIAELEKENAELKDKLEILISVGNTCTKGLNKQLTKAKEIIKKLVNEFYYLCELYNFATDYECLAEAEQFLKESE